MPTWTQNDLDSLKTAVASGILRVVYDGPPRREVHYQDLAEMRKLLADMVADVARAAGGRSYRLAMTRKGL
jgi:hypothetical protein